MEDSNLRKNAPILFGLKKVPNGYTLPDGFFGELEEGIYLKRDKLPKERKLKWIRKWIEISVAAAILVIVFFSGIKILIDKQESSEQAQRKIYNVLDGDMDED